MKEKRKVGRPPKPEHLKAGPNRNFGHVRDADWAEIKAAARRSGKSFTQWATGILLAWAKTTTPEKKTTKIRKS